jgi:NAD(P)H dehydrogenase (quinone)
MKISVILAHPDPKSFNHAVARMVVDRLEKNGHEIFFHDLYAEKFDPILASSEIPLSAPLPQAIKNHCEEIQKAEGIIIVHPNWWGQPPAILKGWIDRVIRPGVAYEFLEGDSGEGVPKGLLMARAALVFNTSNTFPEREHQVFGDPLQTIWQNCVFGLCGVPIFHRHTFTPVATSTGAKRKYWLDEVRRTVDRYFPRPDGRSIKMEINPHFLSPCGLYCGVCAIYIAHRDNNIKLKERLVNLYKGGVPGKGTLPNSQSLTVDDIQCKGCLSDQRFMHCSQCDIRDCTIEKGFTGCHACADFPCHYIENFSMSVGKKVMLRCVPYRKKLGTEPWVRDEEARYICPDCGNKVFRGAVTCNQCKRLLDLD